MADNEDRNQMVDEPAADGAGDGGQSAAEGLHIHGQGHEALEDGVEHVGDPGVLGGSEDIFANANVQSGRRSTNEGLLADLPSEGETLDDQSPVIVDPFTPSEPGNTVDSEFEAVPVGRVREATARDEDDEDEDDEEEQRTFEPEVATLPPGQAPTAGQNQAAAAPQASAFLTGEDVDLSTPAPATSAEPETPAAPADDPADDLPPVAPPAPPTPPAPPSGGDDSGPGAEPAPPTEEPPVEEPPPVVVVPDARVAQTPTLVAADAAGIEDLAIQLNIFAQTEDTDGGNETLTVIIRGVPDGFSFADGTGAAIGTVMSDGGWQIPTDKLDDLWFVRPEHYSGEVPLVVEVTSREVTGHTATVSTPLTVQIEAVADAPVLSAVDTAGTENEWIELSVNAALVDADGSESLAVYITDVPSGAQLSAGTALTEPLDLPGGLTLPAGTWVLSSDDLSGLKVLPAPDDSADFTLKVYAVTEEALNGDRAVTGPAEINVDVGVVAPDVSGSGSGREDEWADVSLSAAVNAADGSEQLFVYIEDLPANVLIQLSDGSALAQDASGRYIVPTDRLGDVQVRWDPATAEHADADISFNVRAVVQDVDVGTDRDTARDTNETVAPVTVTVSAVADAPDVTVETAAQGVENTPIGLDVSATLKDTDGSESLTVYITGVPDGAVLSKGAIVTDLPAGVEATSGTVTWAIQVGSAADLAGLTVTPPTDDSRDFTLKVYGVSEETNPTEAGDVAVSHAVTGPRVIEVDVGVVAPDVSVSGSGLEDQWATVTLDSAINARLGDGSETLTVYLENVPATVSVRYANGDPVPFTDGRYVIDGEHAGLGLQMKWDSPEHTDADITFDVRAVVVDSDGDSNETVVNGVTVTIDAVADEMTLAGSSRGNEDTDIPVSIGIDLIDQDGSERLLGQDGTQPGSVWLVSSSGALAAGTLSLGGVALVGRAVTGYAADGKTPLFDGDTPLTDGDGKPVLAYELPATAFTPVTSGGTTTGYTGPADLSFRPDEHSDSDVDFTIVATVLDNDGSTLTSSGSGTIEVVAVADAPDLTVKDTAGMENKPIALEIGSDLVDRDGSETLTVYITGVPTGAVIAKDGVALTAVTSPVTVDGVTIPADGSTYAIVITKDDSSVDKLSGLTVTSPLNNSADFQLAIHAVTAEARDGDMAITSGTIDVHVGTEAPTLTIADITMSERTSLSENWQAIDIQAVVNAQHKVDGTVGDTETLKVMLYDLPDGVRLQANGTVLTPDASGQYVLTQDMLTSVKISTETHNDADFTFKAKALVEDVDVGTEWETPAGDATAPDSAWSDEVVVNVAVKAEADAANLSGSGVGVEDKLFKLNLGWSAKDSTESVTDVKLSGLLKDTTIQYKDTVTGETVTVIVGNDGIVDLTTADQTTVMAQWPDDKNNFVNSSTGHKGELTLSVTTTEAGSADGGGQIGTATRTTSTTFNVKVFGDADKPYGDTDEAVKTIAEDEWYRVRVGTDDADGVDGTLASGDIFAALRDLDGSESLVVRIKPSVAGSRLAISTDDTITSGEIKAIGGSGYWEVSYSDISSGKVLLQAPPNWSGDDLSFEVTAVSRESDRNVSTSGTGVTRSGTATEVIGTLNFKVTPVADNVTFGTVAGGNEDGVGRDISVTPTVTLDDKDGSESLTSVVMVSSDPTLTVGSVLIGGSAVTRLAVIGYDANGFPVIGEATDTPVTDAAGNEVYAWVLDGAFDLGTERTSYTGSGITVLPQEHSAQEIKYTLVAEVTESDGSTKKTMVADRVITIDAVADKPDLVLTGLKEEAGQRVIEGVEDTAISLGIDAALVDKDGSEVLGVTVSGVPAGWVVGYKTADGTVVEAARLGDGTYDLGGDPAKLATVVVVPPKNLHTGLTGDGDTAAPTFTITATATETGSDGTVAVKTATSTETFKVIVQADADEPFLVVRDVRVDEDAGPVKINITADVTDKVNPEHLTLFVKGVPDGAKLIGADGVVITETVVMDGETWYVVTDHVNDLKVEPKEHSNEDFDLTVRAVSTEPSNGDTAHNDATVRVTVTGTVDKPTWNGVVLTDAVIPVNVGAKEDGGAFNPGLGNLGTEDTDGSETITLVLRGIPAGVEIFMAAGSEQYMKYIGGGRWAIDGDHLDDVRIEVTDKNFSGTKEVAVDLVVTENDGATKTFPHTLEVQIDPVADKPSVSLSGGGAEDSFGADGVPVTITVLPTDLVDEAEQITHISVDFGDMGLSGLKAEIVSVDGTTTRVVDIGGGAEFDLSGEDLAAFYDADTGQMGEIRITGLPDHWSADIPVTIKATSAHGDGEGAETVLSTKVVIDAVVDPAAVFTVAPSAASVASGEKIALGVDLQLTDTDGSESRYLIVEGVPEDARLTGGFNAGNGRWIVSGDAIDSLQVEGAAGASATLTVTAMVRDVDPDDKNVTTWKSDPVSVEVEFTGTPGSGGGTTPEDLDFYVKLDDLSGKEDEPVVLRGTTTRDGASAPSHVSAVILTILTVGVTVASTTKGAFAFYQDEDGNIVIPVESLEDGSVQLIPPQDSDEPISFTMQVVAQGRGEGDFRSDTITLADPVEIPIEAVTDGVTISSDVNGKSFAEDTESVAVNLTITPNERANFSETFTDDEPKIVIRATGLPVDAKLELNGVEVSQDADGAYRIDVSAFGADVADAKSALASGTALDLTGLTVKPPADWHGSVSLEVSVSISDNGTDPEISAGTIAFTVTPVTETGTFTLPTDPVMATEDTAFDITATLVMGDRIGSGAAYASEYVSVVIRGVPEGAVLSGASNNGSYTVDGVTYTEWVVKDGNIAADGALTGVKMTPPADWSGTMDLEIKAFTMEGDVREPVEAASGTWQVVVKGVADMASLDPQNLTDALEGTASKLTLNAQLSDLTGETMWVVIKGVPTGASITDAAGTKLLHVQVDADGKALFDADGNPVVVADGTETGVWVVDQAHVEDAHFLGEENFSGSVDLTAYVVTKEDGTTATSPELPFKVTVKGVADTPDLDLPTAPVSGAEDQARDANGLPVASNGIALGITASLNDPDGETLKLIITGAPADTLFFGKGATPYVAETVDGALVWTIDGEDIADLRMVTPTDWNGTVTLGLEARALEEGTTASKFATLDVEVTPTNDAPTIEVETTGQIVGTGNEPIRIFPDGDGSGAAVVIADVDVGDYLKAMMVSISNGRQPGDTLGITGQTVTFNPIDGRLEVEVDGAQIAISYEASSNTLTFTGEASHEVYQQLAESVILTSGDGSLDAGVRDFTVTVVDSEGAAGTISAQATITDDLTLEDDARGNLFFVTGDTATLTGTDGDDLFVYGVGGADAMPSLVSIDGAGGADTLVMMDGSGVGGDWLFQVDNGSGETPEAPTDGTGGLVYDVEVAEGNATVSEEGRVVDLEPAEDAAPAATITFDDHKVETQDIEHLVT